MDDSHFDHLIRSLASPSRRAVLAALTTALLGGALGLHSQVDAEAKKGKKTTHRGHTGRHAKGTRQDDGRKRDSKRHDHPRTAASDAVRSDGKKKACPPCR